MAAESGGSTCAPRTTGRGCGAGPTDCGTCPGRGWQNAQVVPVYQPGRAAGSVGGVVSATVGYRVGHSVSEADFGNAQPPLEDTGDGEKGTIARSEEHTSELQSLRHLVC